jgi:hypothetical protein
MPRLHLLAARNKLGTFHLLNNTVLELVFMTLLTLDCHSMFLGGMFWS